MAGPQAVPAPGHGGPGSRRDGLDDLVGTHSAGQARLDTPARPVGDAGRGPAAGALGCRWPLHPSHRPDQPAGRGRDPAPGRGRHQRRGTVAADSWPAQSPSGCVVARRALPGHRVGAGPVRRRCDRRGPGRDPAEARPARRRGRGGAVGRLGAMGSPRRRGRGGAAAARHPGAVPGPGRTVRLADGGGRRHAAARAAHGASHPDGHPATAPGRLPDAGRRPGCAAAGRRRRGELAGRHLRGDRPAQLASHRPSHPVDHPRSVPELRSGRRGTRQAAGHPGGLRMRSGRQAQLAHRTDSGRVEPGNARAGAVVGRRSPGDAPAVRVRDGRLLPVAGAGGGAHHGVEELATPGGDLARRGAAHPRLAGLRARPVALVGVDGGGAGPHSLPRPRPAA